MKDANTEAPRFKLKKNVLYLLCIQDINSKQRGLPVSLQALIYLNYPKEWALIVHHAQVLFINIPINYKRTFTNLSR